MAFAAMTSAGLSSRLLAPVDRVTAALSNPARRERAVVVLLLAYVAVWTLYGALQKGSQDLHFDMSELVVWGREPQLGYWKHPPLAAYVVGLWFLVFPTADWAYYLLGMTNAALTLWIAWRIAADYVPDDKRALALVLLTLVPFFNFHALKFNINTVLLPVWAATTYFFLRSFETRGLVSAAFAGLFAAGAMLGKHWSVFLLAALGIAALIDWRRVAYFRSAAPWVTAGVGFLALTPHLGWLIRNEFSTFTFAVGVHGAKPLREVLGGAGEYLAGAAAFVAVPVIFALMATRSGVSQLRGMVWPQEPRRRLVAMAFWGPLLLPVVLAPVIGLALTSIWTMSAWSLLTVVLLSPPGLVADMRASRAIVAFAMLFPLLMVAAAPVIAMKIHRAGTLSPNQMHSQLLTERIEKLWRETTNRPLRLVGGDGTLSFAAAFYSPERPSAFPNLNEKESPWVDQARIDREGLVIVCRTDDRSCLRDLDAFVTKSPAGRRTEVELVRRHFGEPGRPLRYVIHAIPPRR